MLKVPTVDICIESPKQSDYVHIVSIENQNRYILGHGSFGRVYKAIYRDQPVAVKIIRKINKETETSVVRESNILGWNHENIIKILKITSLDDCFTIIMERFKGLCLQQLLNQIKIPLWHRTKISSDIINGLKFCHAKNLVHMDVKPQNVFVAFGGGSFHAPKTNYVSKLFDFGCSEFIDENSCNSNQRGTIRYMSPDILQGFNIGLHDDIYSFGITMWQLKSNADPYHNMPANEFVAYHVVKSNLRPDSELKRFGMNGKENENLENSSGSTANESVHIKSSSYHLIAIKQPTSKLLTPTNQRLRIPLKTQFLSTGHNRKHLEATSSVSSNVVKKLDFNSVSKVNRFPLPSRSVNRNSSTVKHKIYNNSDSTVDGKDVVTFFKDTHQHLSNERKIKIERSYENIYKQCWQQEAIKRPSSQAILDLLNTTFHLFD